MATDPERDHWEPFDDAKLAETHGRLGLRTLRFKVAYTRLQDNIGWFLRGWIHAYPDQAKAAELAFTDLKRLPDSRMLPLLLTASRELSSEGIFQNFSNVFERVKTVRDHVAHARFLNLLLSPTALPSLASRITTGSLEWRDSRTRSPL